MKAFLIPNKFKILKVELFLDDSIQNSFDFDKIFNCATSFFKVTIRRTCGQQRTIGSGTKIGIAVGIRRTATAPNEQFCNTFHEIVRQIDKKG